MLMATPAPPYELDGPARHRSASSAFSSRRRLHEYRARPTLRKHCTYSRGLLLTYALSEAGSFGTRPHVFSLDVLVPPSRSIQLVLDALIPLAGSVQDVPIRGLRLSAPPGRSFLGADDLYDVDEDIMPSLPMDIVAPAESVPVPVSPALDFFELLVACPRMGGVVVDAVASLCKLAPSFTNKFVVGLTRSLRCISERASMLKCLASYYESGGEQGDFEATFVEEAMPHFHRDSMLLDYWGDDDFYFTIRFAKALVSDVNLLCRQLHGRLSSQLKSASSGNHASCSMSSPRAPTEGVSTATCAFYRCSVRVQTCGSSLLLQQALHPVSAHQIVVGMCFRFLSATSSKAPLMDHWCLSW
jgi:hypothetical protein